MFTMNCTRWSTDFILLERIINQGIDSYLEGFTKSSFKSSINRLYCYFHDSEMSILLRRLSELSNEEESSYDVDSLITSIIYSYYGIEL